MDDISPSDLKTILHSKRANLYYLEHCRVRSADLVPMPANAPCRPVGRWRFKGNVERLRRRMKRKGESAAQTAQK